MQHLQRNQQLSNLVQSVVQLEKSSAITDWLFQTLATGKRLWVRWDEKRLPWHIVNFCLHFFQYPDGLCALKLFFLLELFLDCITQCSRQNNGPPKKSMSQSPGTEPGVILWPKKIYTFILVLAPEWSEVQGDNLGLETGVYKGSWGSRRVTCGTEPSPWGGLC